MKRSFSSSLLTKRFQKTFKKELILQGIGLFSGTTSKVNYFFAFLFRFLKIIVSKD